MKKNFRNMMMLAAVCLMGMGTTACSSNDDDNTPVNTAEEQNSDIQKLADSYLSNVVYPTYQNLANETENLYNLISTLKTKLKAESQVSQTDVDNICNSYLKARKYWEQSEAFLYGAASDFEIDPHIDTWPLDVPTLGKDLADDNKIASLDDADGIDFARTFLTPENLGFHGIEFIFFRDGNHRSAAFFNNDEEETDKDIAANGEVTAVEEVIFATAVAGDLRDKCYQLEVAWLGSKANSAHAARVAECAKTSDDFETKVDGMSYGERLLAVGANNFYKSWKKVMEEILVGGCSNICAEVADQKMGQAYRASTSASTTYHEGEDGQLEADDPNYIESPYSHNSFQDFYDNIMSIQNSLYNTIETESVLDPSVMAYLVKYNPEGAIALQTKLQAALAALKACQQSGKSFVENPGAPYVKTAMDAIEELDTELNAQAAWILRN